LLPKVGGGRVAAFDILGNNMRSKESILNGESEGKTYYEIQQASRPFGMITFDDNILELYEKGLITEETAYSYCTRRGTIGRGIDVIKGNRGEATTDIGELTLASDG
jgi:twitching motility protein PilT